MFTNSLCTETCNFCRNTYQFLECISEDSSAFKNIWLNQKNNSTLPCIHKLCSEGKCSTKYFLVPLVLIKPRDVSGSNYLDKYLSISNVLRVIIDDKYLDNCSVTIFIFTFTTWTKNKFLPIKLVFYFW